MTHYHKILLRGGSVFICLLLLDVPGSSTATKSIFQTGTPDEISVYIDALVKKKTADKSTITSLIYVLKAPDRELRVRERAAWALGELNATSGVPALIEAAKHKGLLIRSAALDALVRMRSKDALPIFIEIAENDPILSLRQRATLALGLLQSEKAIPALVKLSSDKTADVKGAAALAMAAMHSKKNDFSEVLKEMAAEEDPYVKSRAQNGLAIVEKKNALIREMLGHEEADIRLFAALYFRFHGAIKDLTFLNDAVAGEAQDDVRHEMNKAIAAIKKRNLDAQTRARQKKEIQKVPGKTSSPAKSSK